MPDRRHSAMLEVLVLSDSHLRGGLDDLGEQVLRSIAEADVVLHAGDITSHQALDELRSITETFAVLGNNDRDLGGLLPDSQLLELAGVSIALVHDSGATKGRANRLHRRFPTAQLVVFGHSHIPVNELGIGGQILFNPGSPTQRRTQPHRTYGWLTLRDGAILRREIEIVRE